MVDYAFSKDSYSYTQTYTHRFLPPPLVSIAENFYFSDLSILLVGTWSCPFPSVRTNRPICDALCNDVDAQLMRSWYVFCQEDEILRQSEMLDEKDEKIVKDALYIEELAMKAGSALFLPSFRHAGQNLSSQLPRTYP